MPIPPETKISHNVDQWDESGEYIGDEYHMVHVPCPTSHVAQTAFERVEGQFSLRETKYDAIDGGHAVFLMTEDVDPEAVADAAETARDAAREEHGVDPYSPDTNETKTSTNTEQDEDDDQPRYIQ